MTFDERPTSLSVVPISANPDDRWRLTDQYVEEVWSELLGPTATLLARRLGRVIEVRPGGVQLDLGDVAESLGVGRSLVVKAFERLHRFDVVHSDLERGIVGVSGYAPSVADVRLHRLSDVGRIAHDRLVAEAAVHERPVGRASAILIPTSPSRPSRSRASIALA